MAKSSKLKPPKARLTSVFADPPRKNVMLLSCMDQRLLDDTVHFMNDLNLQNRYDQVALAGGAMGAHHLFSPTFFVHLKEAINTLHRPIKDVFLFEHLDCGAYKYLHPDPEIQKGYKDSSLARMRKYHRRELRVFARKVNEFILEQRELAEAEYERARKACEKCEQDEKKGPEEETCWERVAKLAWEKAEAWTDIRVSYFVMDILGEVTQLDVPDGEPATLEC